MPHWKSNDSGESALCHHLEKGFLLCLSRAKLHGYKTIFSSSFPLLCFVSVLPIFCGFVLSFWILKVGWRFFRKCNTLKKIISIKFVTLFFVCLEHGFRPEDFETWTREGETRKKKRKIIELLPFHNVSCMEFSIQFFQNP